MRKLSFYFGLLFLFTVFTVLPELVYFLTGTNTYLLYLIVPGAVLGALFTGGVWQTARRRAAWYWIAFFLWMAIAVPFSSWKGGSTGQVYNYARANLPLLFVVGGLATNWKEIRAIFYTIASAGIVSLLTARIFAKEESGRFSLSTDASSIGNSNDLAAHLIILLPFLLYILMDRKRNPLIRGAMVPAMAYGVWVILGTASRGGLLALSAMFLFMFLRASAKMRLAAMVTGLALIAASFTVLPRATLARLGSLFGEEHIEAEASADSRSYLFKTSVRYTLEHPMFGVGPGQFANFEGGESTAAGKFGNWHATHCSWTQISSECGIPALLFFVLGIGSALLMVHRAWRQARRQGFTDIANACFCYLVAMVGFLVAITFLANAYRFYFPAMIGLAISISFVAKRHMSATAEDRSFTAPVTPQPLAVH